MASPAWRMPAMDCSSLSSMAFRPWASSSNSSPELRVVARALQVARLHRGHHPVQLAHAALDVAADQQAPAQAQGHDQGPGAPERARHPLQVRLGVAEVHAHEQPPAARQRLVEPARGAAHHVARSVGVGDLEIAPGPVAALGVDGAGGDVAGMAAVRVGQEIEVGPAAQGAVDHRGVQRVGAALAVDGLQPRHLARDIGVRPPTRLLHRRHIDVGEQRRGRRGEQRQEQQGQPEGRAPDERGQAHWRRLRLPAGSPRRARSAAWAC